MTKKRRDSATISQIDLFDALDTPTPDQQSGPSVHTCESCRHWHRNAPVYDRLTGKFTENKWHHCAQLYVVTKREYGSQVEAGTVLRKEEAQEALLTNIDYLNTAPFFDCSQWEARKEEAA